MLAKREFYLRGVVFLLGCFVGLPLAASQDREETMEEDPYLWLEEVESEQALEWARQRNLESAREVENEPGFRALEARLLEVYESSDKIPYVRARGDYVYNFWRDEKAVRGLWRRTSLASYRTDEPEWEILLDLDALAAEEEENWVWKGPLFLEPDLDRALLRLSRGGGDAVVIREFDVEKKRFAEAGFALPEGKNSASWLDRDTLLVRKDWGEGSLTPSGYPRIAKMWRRGTPLNEAEEVFAGEPNDVSAGAYAYWHNGERIRMAYRTPEIFKTLMFLWRDGAFIPIEKPDDAQMSLVRDHLLIETRTDWELARTWKAGSLLAIKLEAFLAGNRDFDLLYEPGPRRSLKGYEVTPSAIIINELKEVRDQYTVARWNGEGWEIEPLDVPGFGRVEISAYDSEHSEKYWITVNDFLTPTTLYLAELGTGQAEAVKSLPSYFDQEGLLIEQHNASSADGTHVPYFLIRRKEIELDGSHPTLLYGYGGFQVSLESSYSATRGLAWLEKGGIFVQGNIRGGGEFGPEWHKAALRENKQRSYDDFIAIAEDLIERGYTSPARLGIIGGSNGGLLTGNMLVQRPDLFGAVVSAVPLLDMKRYNKLLAGASWIGEYGDPDKPEDWAFLKNFSPYQLVRADVDYPPVLFTTSTRDDRVHPAHARKMVARMLDQGHKRVYYYENIEGGHGGAANLKQSAYLGAYQYTFLWKHLATKSED